MMKTIETKRGFRLIVHQDYAARDFREVRLIQESSAIGCYKHAYHNPGSSFLWIGENHHLNREEVAELIKGLQFWLDNKRLKLK